MEKWQQCYILIPEMWPGIIKLRCQYYMYTVMKMLQLFVWVFYVPSPPQTLLYNQTFSFFKKTVNLYLVPKTQSKSNQRPTVLEAKQETRPTTADCTKPTLILSWSINKWIQQWQFTFKDEGSTFINGHTNAYILTDRNQSIYSKQTTKTKWFSHYLEMMKVYGDSPCAGTWPQKWSMSKLQKGNGFRMQNRALANYIKIKK
jgi:hypothetical protein